MPLQTNLPLPEPGPINGSLFDALKNRCSIRSYTGQALSEQVLSDMLWAAFGINRPKTGLLTAPSPRNCQETDIYVSLETGTFVYRPATHSLDQINDQDMRGACGMQAFAAAAPVNLVYVADMARMGNVADKDAKLLYAYSDAGAIGQNVSLFCAAAGLGTVVRGSINRQMLSEQFGLTLDQVITLAQSVGYPK